MVDKTNFWTEFFTRLKTETPKWWKKFRWGAGIIGASALAIYLTIKGFNLDADYTTLKGVCEKVMFFCAGVTGTAFLPVNDRSEQS